MTQQEADDALDVVTGTLPICHISAHVLLDLGATHSFVASMFSVNIGGKLEPLFEELFIYTPVGDLLVTSNVYKNCVVEIDGVTMTGDLIPLDIQEFDVILGMDFLSKYRATMDCFPRRLYLKDSKGLKLFSGETEKFSLLV